MFTVIVFEWLLVEKAWRYSCTIFCFSAVALMKYVAPKHGKVDTAEDPWVLDRKQYTRLTRPRSLLSIFSEAIVHN